MKRLFQRLAASAGLLVVRRSHAGARYVENPPRGAFDEVLLRVFPSCQGLSFIQVGANDGIRADPIRRYIVDYGWSGLLIEPVPRYYEALRRNYAHRPGLTFLNAAIDTTCGERAMYYLAPETPGVPDWAHGLASFDRQRIDAALAGLGVPGTATVAENVATMTWEAVLKECNRPCDVLVIDAEGHDIPLLRLLDLRRVRPTVIHFEHACAPAADRLSFYGELLESGYEIASAGGDTIAYLPRGSR